MENEDDYEEPSDAESDSEDQPTKSTAPAKPAVANSDAEASDADSEVEASDAESDVEEDSDIGEEVAIPLDQARPFSEFETNFSDDEDDDDEDDENYLQKFDSLSQKNIISDYHPELQKHNYEEVEILSRIVRDENGHIVDPLHKTLPFITKYEKARILGERAKQLDAGAMPLIEIDSSVIDGYLIALKEFESKVIPFIIQRPLPSGASEYWKFSDLEILA